MEKPKIVCVVGPTASGKTDYAIEIAKRRGGEVVSCDSMQIYKYMDIGTAKPSREEMQGIRHHMIDFVDPNENYSVADFVRDASACIADILSRGRLPVLCGGTGLYVDSIINRIEFSDEARDDSYRESLKLLAASSGTDAVYAVLQEADPEAAEKIHPNNLKRVIRTLEIIKSTGLSKAEADRRGKKEPLYDAEIFGLRMDREKLYQRINLRVDIMMKKGLLEEVKELIKMGIPRDSTAMQAIGYKELLVYLDGKCSLDEAIEKIKQESRHYAKRQLTWFRRNPDIKWIEAGAVAK